MARATVGASRDEAKGKISKLFAGGETLYFSDVADRLGLALDLVVDVCMALVDEGEIESVVQEGPSG